MKLNVFLQSHILVLVILSIFLSIIYFEDAKSQTTSSNDPEQILKEFQTQKDAIQEDIQVNFDELINEVQKQLNFSSVDEHLSLSSQHLLNERISEALSELEIAKEEWQNSSLTIIDEGNDFILIAKNNSISMENSTREILEHFGNILVDLGTKVDNLNIKLN